MAEFKLKDLKALELKNGDKVEVEVEGVEKGKVLLVKVGGKVHALNANCTHFGAPLKNGILSPDGRLTCPWHGACFNVTTGDVEDAPAPDPLHKFDLEEKDGGVYIKGQEAHIKAGRRQPKVNSTVAEKESVVIVGGGSATFGAVQKLRELDYTGKVTIIGNEGYLPIDRTKLSKALISDPDKVALRKKDWYESASIDCVNDTVTSVDFDKKSVSTWGGKSYPYTKLVLASGGTPKRLPMSGFKDLSNIFVMRTVNDVKDIMDAVGTKGKDIVIIGSSFIGMEAANALAKENTVTIVGMEDAPLERVMGKEVGVIFQRSLEKNGAKFYMGASVDVALPSSKDSKAVGAVKLKDGTEIPADLVILGIGVGPATEYLKGNGNVELLKDGSLTVDKHFEVDGLQGVYAIGDIATYPYHGPGGEGKPVRIEHWNVAQNAGKAVAEMIARGKMEKAFQLPVFWSALGGQLRYCGNTVNGFDELVLKGKPEEGKFIAYYAKGETVVAVASMMMDPLVMKSVELMRRGKMPSKSELKDGADVMQVDVE